MGKSSKKKAAPGASAVTAEGEDQRFDASKPQFRKSTEKASNNNKVVLDDRFASVLTDPRFQLTSNTTADKYGRVKAKDFGREQLSAFYTVIKEDENPAASRSEGVKCDSDIDASADSDAKPKSAKDTSKKKAKKEERDEDPATRIAYLTALSRGEVDVSSSSSDGSENSEAEDSEDDDDDNDSATAEDPANGAAGVLDPSSKRDDEVELTLEESPYMAVLNLDWSHLRAVDIFTILSSFTPPGAVKRVQVYPSDFGKERLKMEERFGPLDVWKKKKKGKDVEFADEADDPVDLYQSDDDDDESEDGESDRDDESADEDEDVDMRDAGPDMQESGGNSDFDPEKLRKYEASRLKYYFAVVEFASPQYADIAYKEVDGMEFEHSSAAVDLRSIPVHGLEDVTKNRELRDEATNIPSNYVPPEFIVNALQQSTVQCSWDIGDRDRETLLTKYTSGPTWSQITAGDDLKAYLASDHSSDEESDAENEKASQMRKMLGLDSDDDDDDEGNEKGSGSESSSESDEDDDKGAEGSKTVRFVPGKPELAAKLRSDLEPEAEKKELTPWEKYQEKRKQKRNEKRQALREKRKEVTEMRKHGGMREKPTEDVDDFFVSDGDTAKDGADRSDRLSSKQTKEELELMVAGDANEERDFDMRGLERMEKNKGKKLRGARKRKEDKLAVNITGTDFKVDTTDARFKAVLEGSDDRFGIDRTDPNFKETTAMREILAEQTRQRKKKRKTNGDRTIEHIAPDVDVSADAAKQTSGSAALSELVRSIKSRINR